MVPIIAGSESSRGCVPLDGAVWLMQASSLRAPTRLDVKDIGDHLLQYFELSGVHPEAMESLQLSALSFTQGATVTDTCALLFLRNSTVFEFFLFFLYDNFGFFFFSLRKANILQSPVL